MNVPQVSVVMSVFNGERYLRQAVESILDQTFTDFEFIIIDDGSLDSTWDILQLYDVTDPRICLFRNETNIGLTQSLNLGISYARGNFIARQDADDWSNNRRLAEQIRYLEANPDLGLLGTAYNVVNSLRNFISEVFPPAEDKVIRQVMWESNPFCHGSIMVRAKFLRAVGGYRKEFLFSQDYDLWLRLVELTRMANLQEPLYNYSISPKAISTKRAVTQAGSAVAALEDALLRDYAVRNLDPEKRTQLLGKQLFRAACIAYANQTIDTGKHYLQRLVQLAPEVLEEDKYIVNAMVDIVLPTWVENNIEGHLKFLTTMFSNLPARAKFLTKHKNKIFSKIHCREGFRAYQNKCLSKARDFFIYAIRYDPAILLNSGVRSILLETLIGSTQADHIRHLKHRLSQ